MDSKLLVYLEGKGVRTRPSSGWQSVRCFNASLHSHGDRTRSASVNLTKGKYKCFACGLSGDVYDLVQQIEGVDFKEAMAILGKPSDKGKDEPTWL